MCETVAGEENHDVDMQTRIDLNPHGERVEVRKVPLHQAETYIGKAVARVYSIEMLEDQVIGLRGHSPIVVELCRCPLAQRHGSHAPGSVPQMVCVIEVVPFALPAARPNSRPAWRPSRLARPPAIGRT